MKNNQIILAIGICIAIATSANVQGNTRTYAQKSLAANAQGSTRNYPQKDIETDAREPIDYVDPFIGTTNFSVCNPGAICPNGMMSVVPFNVMGSDLNVYDKDKRWWSAPYEYKNKYFTGFAHVTLSGVGCPELGTLLLMPTSGKLDVNYQNYGSTYHNEKATPGYYSSELDKYGIRCEVTSAMRSSVERFTFRKGEGNILLNIGDGLTNEVGGMLKRVSDNEIEGIRLLGTFCYNPQAVFPMYFVMRINKKATEQGYWKKQPTMAGVEGQWDPDNGKYKLYRHYGKEMAGNEIGYYYHFECEEGEQVEVQMGVSFVSMDNARENLDKEQPTMDFDKVRQEARRSWEQALGKITVEGGTDAQKRIFYTALYHTQIHPNILQDVNGEYPKMESDATGKTGTNRYTVFSLWDTYRNMHQLLTLLYPDKQTDMVRSMIDMYKEWGWMPKWELYGRETWTMEGDPSIPVITDTYLKGLRDFDIGTAYQAFVKSATTPGRDNRMRPDIDMYLKKGYVPLGEFSADQSGDNSVSHALEYYVADNALANLAQALGHKEEGNRFERLSQGYKNYYSKEYGTLRPKYANGTFLTPFDPKAGENFSNAPGFHEGSAWNYTFYVPFDIRGLAELMGGGKKFVDKLQMVFDQNLYDPANEPDIAYPYLFNYFKGDEWRTQKETHRILEKYYKDAPDGIPGNDDCGTMSAWALFTMMGLYPDCPGSPYYALTAPVFDKITLHLDKKYYPNGDITIEAKHSSPNDIYIKGISLGGKKWNGYRISHQELVRGCHLKYILGEEK
jgi:predicted alpha-1,2-mannosidase